MRSNQFRARAAGHANRVARRRLIAALAALVAAAVLAWPVGAQQSGAVPSIELTGTIDPATAGWISSALEDAQGAPLAIIRLDTPGGLDTSMREIIQDIIAAPMPVVVYVSPDGARAASAGLFITDAADYVRALAEGHGRNPDLAERMVTDAENRTASEALDAGLIDVVASSEEE